MNWKRGIVLHVFACLTIATSIQTNDVVELSFDNLFPSSPFKHALDICMQLYGDLAGFKEEQLLPRESAIAMDTMLGQLLRLRASVHSVYQTNPKPVSADDKIYICVMIARLETAYLESSLSPEHMALGTMMLGQIKNAVNALAAQESF